MAKITSCILWNTYKHLPLKEFSKKINAYKYKPDLVNGVVDFAYENPNVFFSELGVSRDCDDYARVYYHYGLVNNYTPQEVIITTKEHIIKDSHVVCVLEKDSKYWLCDYEVYGTFNSIEEAIMAVPNHWEKYTKENLLYEYYYGMHTE